MMHSRAANIFIGITLAVVWGFFAWTHVGAYEESGKIAFILFALSETLQAFFFLFRKMPSTVSVDPFDWLIAGAGSFLPLFLRPGGLALFSGGEALVLIGVTIQILGLLSLNRSFAIVAAKRVVKTTGLYGFIRHPMYASYIFLFSGYVLFNMTPLNLGIIALSFIFMFLRLTQEEKLLSRHEEYKAYMQRVRWRLIPFIY